MQWLFTITTSLHLTCSSRPIGVVCGAALLDGFPREFFRILRTLDLETPQKRPQTTCHKQPKNFDVHGNE